MLVKRHQLKPERSYFFNNARMGFSVIGKGKPVILLHGSIISNPWYGFEEELAKFYKVYIPYLPGFGSSDAVNGKRHTTDLFADALCTFVNETKLNDAPVVALSLGSVVTVKSAAKGCIKGDLILVGMPGKVRSKKLETASLIPVWLRHLFGSTVWARKRILIPAIQDALGSKSDKKLDEELLDSMSEIDTRSLVDPDPYNEIVLKIPMLLPKITNRMTFIYGENDKLIESTKDLISDPIIIKNAGHNIFRSEPDKTLAILKGILQ